MTLSGTNVGRCHRRGSHSDCSVVLSCSCRGLCIHCFSFWAAALIGVIRGENTEDIQLDVTKRRALMEWDEVNSLHRSEREMRPRRRWEESEFTRAVSKISRRKKFGMFNTHDAAAQVESHLLAEAARAAQLQNAIATQDQPLNSAAVIYSSPSADVPQMLFV
jgi:hypothetical protein